ncbi:MAG: DegT/DnrJ/EryC1/StrS family aminotransferase, partial [Anaerolineae bacterium]|nr:DegT/DnrJ/EryC1/StrS family aminotransferase [Anaerolineae bacterium]
TKKTKAIIPVHLYGQPVDMEPMLEIANRYGLIVIEDACQAHGAKYKNKRTGSMGHAAAFSFYPAKNLGCYGDGGAITTNDPKIYETLRRLRDYGAKDKYYHIQLGYNRRLDTLQASVLRVKLKYLDAWNQARRQHATLYAKLLTEIDIAPPDVPAYAEPVWHLYVIRLKNRDEIRTKLAEKGISTGIHYPVPIHLQQAYEKLGYKKGSFPTTEACAEQILSLPMYAELNDDMIKFVVASIKEML